VHLLNLIEENIEIIFIDEFKIDESIQFNRTWAERGGNPFLKAFTRTEFAPSFC